MEVEGSAGIVTGGGSGIGAAVVRLLAQGGGSVAILDLADSAGPALADELGDAVRFHTADITDPEQVKHAIEASVAHLGRLDLLVNCAAVSPAHRVLASDGIHPIELFRRTIDVNLIGLFDAVRRGAREMASNEPGVDGERGLIVNIGSIAGLEGQVGQAAYAASKAAVMGLTIQLARDLARNGIRVMAVAPGIIDTPRLRALPRDYVDDLVRLHQFPARIGRAEEVAQLVRVFMETTLLNGEVVRVDAAARLPPS